VCCRGRDRRRTDRVRNRSAVLQRERLGNCLPVARQRSDQDFPARCSAPSVRRHARPDGPGLGAGPRPGDVNGRGPRIEIVGARTYHVLNDSWRRSRRRRGAHSHTATGAAGFGRQHLALSSVGEEPVTGAAHRFDGGHPEWDVDVAPQ